MAVHATEPILPAQRGDHTGQLCLPEGRRTPPQQRCGGAELVACHERHGECVGGGAREMKARELNGGQHRLRRQPNLDVPLGTLPWQRIFEINLDFEVPVVGYLRRV